MHRNSVSSFCSTTSVFGFLLTSTPNNLHISTRITKYITNISVAFLEAFLEADEPGGGRGYHTFLHVPRGDGWKLSASSFIITLRFITVRDSSQTRVLPFALQPYTTYTTLMRAAPALWLLVLLVSPNECSLGEAYSKISSVLRKCRDVFLDRTGVFFIFFYDNVIILLNRRRDLAYHKVWELLYFLKETFRESCKDLLP